MMEKNFLVSIIMPAYNCEKYISESIDSVLNQTYRDWELLIINDWSTDNTLNIIEEYSIKDSRIKVISNYRNLGVSATRNRGIELATGEWIAFLDSDDIWKPEKIKTQVSIAKKENAEFVFTASAYINESGKAYKGIFEVPQTVTYKKLRNHNVISCSSVLVKKKYFENIKMEKDEIHEDYAVWLRILRLGVIAYGVNQPLLVYRISKGSKSGNKLKTIKMTYNVYRFLGINPIISLYFMIRHLVASIVKYSKIKYINI